MPELLQGECRPERLAAALAPLMEDSHERAAELAAFARLGERMRLPGGLEPSEARPRRCWRRSRVAEVRDPKPVEPWPRFPGSTRLRKRSEIAAPILLAVVASWERCCGDFDGPFEIYRKN